MIDENGGKRVTIEACKMAVGRMGAREIELMAFSDCYLIKLVTSYPFHSF